ncbi:hypothetical protein H0H92_006053 [Tricholoma furcatifolium]|nr:hypothetical protein H0H92_006053 [Tricholoma furcatifolium]
MKRKASPPITQSKRRKEDQQASSPQPASSPSTAHLGSPSPSSTYRTRSKTGSLHPKRRPDSPFYEHAASASLRACCATKEEEKRKLLQSSQKVSLSTPKKRIRSISDLPPDEVIEISSDGEDKPPRKRQRKPSLRYAKPPPQVIDLSIDDSDHIPSETPVKRKPVPLPPSQSQSSSIRCLDLRLVGGTPSTVPRAKKRTKPNTSSPLPLSTPKRSQSQKEKPTQSKSTPTSISRLPKVEVVIINRPQTPLRRVPIANGTLTPKPRSASPLQPPTPQCPTPIQHSDFASVAVAVAVPSTATPPAISENQQNEMTDQDQGHAIWVQPGDDDANEVANGPSEQEQDLQYALALSASERGDTVGDTQELLYKSWTAGGSVASGEDVKSFEALHQDLVTTHEITSVATETTTESEIIQSPSALSTQIPGRKEEDEDTHVAHAMLATTSHHSTPTLDESGGTHTSTPAREVKLESQTIAEGPWLPTSVPFECRDGFESVCNIDRDVRQVEESQLPADAQVEVGSQDPLKNETASRDACASLVIYSSSSFQPRRAVYDGSWCMQQLDELRTKKDEHDIVIQRSEMYTFGPDPDDEGNVSMWNADEQERRDLEEAIFRPQVNSAHSVDTNTNIESKEESRSDADTYAAPVDLSIATPTLTTVASPQIQSPTRSEGCAFVVGRLTHSFFAQSCLSMVAGSVVGEDIPVKTQSEDLPSIEGGERGSAVACVSSTPVLAEQTSVVHTASSGIEMETQTQSEDLPGMEDGERGSDVACVSSTTPARTEQTSIAYTASFGIEMETRSEEFLGMEGGERDSTVVCVSSTPVFTEQTSVAHTASSGVDQGDEADSSGAFGEVTLVLDDPCSVDLEGQNPEHEPMLSTREQNEDATPETIQDVPKPLVNEDDKNVEMGVVLETEPTFVMNSSSSEPGDDVETGVIPPAAQTEIGVAKEDHCAMPLVVENFDGGAELHSEPTPVAPTSVPLNACKGLEIEIGLVQDVEQDVPEDIDVPQDDSTSVLTPAQPNGDVGTSVSTEPAEAFVDIHSATALHPADTVHSGEESDLEASEVKAQLEVALAGSVVGDDECSSLEAIPVESMTKNEADASVLNGTATEGDASLQVANSPVFLPRRSTPEVSDDLNERREHSSPTAQDYSPAFQQEPHLSASPSRQPSTGYPIQSFKSTDEPSPTSSDESRRTLFHRGSESSITTIDSPPPSTPPTIQDLYNSYFIFPSDDAVLNQVEPTTIGTYPKQVANPYPLLDSEDVDDAYLMTFHFEYPDIETPS